MTGGKTLSQFAGVTALLGVLFVCVVACPNFSNERITVDGRVRTYRLHVPDALPEQTAVPLVIALHGFGGTGRMAATAMWFEPVADREGFIVAYPDAVNRTWRYRPEEQPIPAVFSQDVDDAAFVEQLIDHLVETRNVDPARVYVTGFSNGGFMAHRLGCSLADRVAAIAPVCANLSPGLAAECDPARPLPVLMICGKEDPFIPWEGGTTSEGGGPELELLSAEASAAEWGGRNGCGPPVAAVLLPDTDPGDGTRVERTDFGSCVADTTVVLYGIEGGGHTWPGSQRRLPEGLVGRTSRDIDATEIIWEFFKTRTLSP